MSSPKKKPGDPPGPSESPLRDRVSFFEKVWTGSPSGVLEGPSAVDVEELERRLDEERQRHAEHAHLEQVSLRHAPLEPDGSFQETVTSTVEEGDLASGVKTVKFEKVTVRKTVRQVTGNVSTTHRVVTSRTPSEERVLEDSAYQTHSNGNLSTHSNSSSVSSLTGRFPSEENLLRRTPSREYLKDDSVRDECDSVSGSSRLTTSSSEWYNEYRSQTFQNTSKLEYVRSKSQYDNHIAVMRGQHLIHSF